MYPSHIVLTKRIAFITILDGADAELQKTVINCTGKTIPNCIAAYKVRVIFTTRPEKDELQLNARHN